MRFPHTCCPALPSPGPESSSEQLAVLEQKLRCLEQEKMELSRKLQGTGGASWARAGWVPPRTSCSPMGAPQPRRCPAGLLGPSGAGAATEGSAGSTAQAGRYPPPPLTLEAELLAQHPSRVSVLALLCG